MPGTTQPDRPDDAPGAADFPPGYANERLADHERARRNLERARRDLEDLTGRRPMSAAAHRQIADGNLRDADDIGRRLVEGTHEDGTRAIALVTALAHLAQAHVQLADHLQTRLTDAYMAGLLPAEVLALDADHPNPGPRRRAARDAGPDPLAALGISDAEFTALFTGARNLRDKPWPDDTAPNDTDHLGQPPTQDGTR